MMDDTSNRDGTMAPWRLADLGDGATRSGTLFPIRTVDRESFDQGWMDGFNGLRPDGTAAISTDDYLAGHDMGTRRRRESRPALVIMRNIRLDEHGFVQGDPVVKEAR